MCITDYVGAEKSDSFVGAINTIFARGAVSFLCSRLTSELHSFMPVNLFPFVTKESHCMLNIYHTAIPVFKNLQSLEVCGGFITDAGVKNIKDLIALTLLNLSQNGNLTDKTLELISGTCSFNACSFIARFISTPLVLV
jgi:hypothetical protein